MALLKYNAYWDQSIKGRFCLTIFALAEKIRTMKRNSGFASFAGEEDEMDKVEEKTKSPADEEGEFESLDQLKEEELLTDPGWDEEKEE